MPNSSVKKANEAKSFFYCAGHEESTFEVTQYDGTDSISSPYHFDIMLTAASDTIDPSSIISKQGSVFIHRDGEFYPYSGIISEFTFIEKNLAHCVYSVKLVPRLWTLDLNVQSRIFQKMSSTDIIKKVLSDGGITDVTYDLGGSYQSNEYIVQYQESDLNFISRLMESAGIFYFFKENPLLEEELKNGCTSEQLIITDKPGSFTDINGVSSVSYKSKSSLIERDEDKEKESINKITFESHIVPQEVMLRNYNYRTPENMPSGKSKVKDGHAGTVYMYGGSARDVNDANAQAKLLANRIMSTQTQVTGSGNCAGLRAGSRFTITDYVKDQMLLVTLVIHKGGHLTGDDTDRLFTYKNTFEALPEAQANLYAPQKRTPVPVVPGITTAKIEAEGSSYAALDDKGRYKIRLPFDISSAKNYDGSKYVRLAQPYSGAQYGIHFPSHEGAEMVLACIDGDPNKPLGLGTVPNFNTISPVVSGNKAQNIIRTAGGNEMVMDDTDGKQTIWIQTKGKHRIEENDDTKSLSITSTDKNELLLDDKNEMVSWNGKNHKITMTYKNGSEGIVIVTDKGNTIKIDDKNKKITVQTAGGHTIDMDDDGKKILLADGQGKNKVTLDGNGGLVLDSQGKIEITAQQDLTITAMNIKMTANAAFEANATQDFKAHGMNVNLKGDMNGTIEAGMNLDLKGMQSKLEGTMVDVEGSAMTKVKGGMVMIN